MSEETNRLPVMEQFYTVQGEGYNTGKAAYFIRLGGCDVGCVWCDVKESWDANKHPLFTNEELLKNVLQHPAKTVVITGGEPCMYDLTELTDTFKANGINIWLETSGAYEIKGTFDWICVSPKKFKQPITESLAKANELKVVVFNNDDFKWAEKNAALTNKSCKLYLQPEWGKSDALNGRIVDYVKQHPQWTISLQTHKYLNIS